MAALIPSASATGSGTMTLAGPSTNSNQTITIPDATGTMMVSGNMPAFRGALATNLTVSNSTDTQISFNTEQFDTASAYSSGTFTVPVSGYYAVNCFIAWSGDITGYWNFYWKVNGSIAYTNAYQIQFTAAAHGVSGSDLLYLTAGQTLTSFVSQQSGSTKYVTAGGETFASIVLVRTA
jgi:hypothetical protein